MTHETGIEAGTDALAAYINASGVCLDVGFEKALQAYLYASGLVLVPREPDDEILDKMNTGFWFDPDDAKNIWVALVNASSDQIKSNIGK